MIFSKEEVNTGRQLCIDFAKAFAIIFMPLSHVFEYTYADHTTGLAYFIMFIGSHHFAAPVFMLSMGLGMTYSRRNDPNTMMKRGLSIFTAGIILNMARFLAAMTGFLATDNPDMQYLAIGELVIVDIFQLAGLSMMLMGLFLRIRMPYWGMLLFAVAASLTGSQMHMITTGNNLADSVLGLFVGIHGYYCDSYFPLLNWFIFIVAGYGLGKLMRRCTAPGRLFLIMTPITLLIYLAYTLYAAPLGIDMFNTESSLHFYQIRSFDAFISLCAALATVGVGYFIMNIFPESLQNAISRIAADLMRIYVLQWLIITWVIRLLLEEIIGLEFGVNATILVGLCVLVASVLLARVKPFSKMKV